MKYAVYYTQDNKYIPQMAEIIIPYDTKDKQIHNFIKNHQEQEITVTIPHSKELEDIDYIILDSIASSFPNVKISFDYERAGLLAHSI